MIFKGSGKECRLQVMKLNELKGVNDQNDQSAENHNQFSGSPSESKSSSFRKSSHVNEDTSYDSVVNTTVFEEKGNIEVNELDVHRNSYQNNKKIRLEPMSTWSAPNNDEDEYLDDALSKCLDQCDDPVYKRKMASTVSTQSEWSKFLPDDFNNDEFDT